MKDFNINEAASIISARTKIKKEIVLDVLENYFKSVKNHINEKIEKKDPDLFIYIGNFGYFYFRNLKWKKDSK